MIAAATERDRQTARTHAGVRVPPIWPGARIHAFRRWRSQTVCETWCGQVADLNDGAEQTTALVNCSDCARASLEAFRR